MKKKRIAQLWFEAAEKGDYEFLKNNFLEIIGELFKKHDFICDVDYMNYESWDNKPRTCIQEINNTFLTLGKMILPSTATSAYNSVE